jgi:hypothetical protein
MEALKDLSEGSHKLDAMRDALVLLLILALITPICSCQAGASTTPVILIYSPNAPGYGEALKRLIEEDERFEEAKVRMCNNLEDLKVGIFFPDVKAAVITLASDVGQELNATLQWFFGNGGGLIGMGFASTELVSRNASRDVFPSFGNAYRSATYDPATRKFIMSLIKEEEDEISQGVPSFTIPQHKIMVHIDPSTREFRQRYPESGEYKLLFTEENSGAPAIIKYRDRGVSVTFTTFGGDDESRGPSYHGLFVDQPEFKTLFTNSLYWVWENEEKFQESVEKAAEYYQSGDEHLDEVQTAAERAEKGKEMFRLIRDVTVVLAAGICCVAIYWATFIRARSSTPE